MSEQADALREQSQAIGSLQSLAKAQQRVLDMQQQELEAIKLRAHLEEKGTRLQSQLRLADAELAYRQARPHAPIHLADMTDWQAFHFMLWVATSYREAHGEYPDYIGLMIEMAFMSDDDPSEEEVSRWIGRGIRQQVLTTVLLRSDLEPEEWGDDDL